MTSGTGARGHSEESRPASSGSLEIRVVRSEAQLELLIPLLRAYCDFYHVAPDDQSLLSLGRALIADPVREGVQLLATQEGKAVGFATIFWTWATTIAGRIGIMNDLFVVEAARGAGAGAALLEACRRRCHEQGALQLVWQTAPDNVRAQALYERVGAVREEWIDYWIATDG